MYSTDSVFKRKSTWPDAERCWLLQAKSRCFYIGIQQNQMPKTMCPENTMFYAMMEYVYEYEYIYIYAAWNSILSLQHTATRALESKLLETKEILCICFPEILRRKQEIWDLGTGAISTRKVHWRVLGGISWTIHTFLTLGCHGREDIWRYLGILGFAAVSTRIHNHPQDSPAWKKHRSTTPSSSMYLRCS